MNPVFAALAAMLDSPAPKPPSVKQSKPKAVQDYLMHRAAEKRHRRRQRPQGSSS